MIDDAKSNSKLMITLQDKAAAGKLPLSDFDFVAADFFISVANCGYFKEKDKIYQLSWQH